MFRIPFESIAIDGTSFRIIDSSLRMVYRAGRVGVRLKPGPINGQMLLSEKGLDKLRRSIRPSRNNTLKTIISDANGSEANFVDGTQELSLSGRIKSKTRINRVKSQSSKDFITSLSKATEALLSNPSFSPNQLVPVVNPPQPDPAPSPSPSPSPPPSPSGGGESGGGGSSRTFLLSVNSATSEMSFGGSATGSISLTGPVGSTSTFSRQGLTQATSISPLNTYTIILSNASNDFDASAYNDAVNSSGINVTGSAVEDSIRGSLQADVLAGGNGNDTITGGSGDDNVSGGSGDDELSGDDGSDIVTGGAGADTISGGADDDLFLFDTGDVVAGELIDGGSGANTLRVTTSTDFTDLSTTTIRTAGNVQNIQIQDGQTATFLGSQLTAQAVSVNRVAVGANPVILDVNVVGTTTVDLSQLTFASVGAGTQFISGTDMVDIDGDAGSNTITGPNIAADINGDSGDDNITGGTANDTIDGGNGSDMITGGNGIDQLTGGANSDTFIWTTQIDPTNANQLNDFTVSQNDLLAFSAATFDSYTAGQSIVISSVAGFASGDVIIDNDPTITSFNLKGLVTGRVIAIASDTGTIYTGVNGGSGVSWQIIGNIAASQAALLAAGNLSFIA